MRRSYHVDVAVGAWRLVTSAGGETQDVAVDVVVGRVAAVHLHHVRRQRRTGESGNGIPSPVRRELHAELLIVTGRHNYRDEVVLAGPPINRRDVVDGMEQLLERP